MINDKNFEEALLHKIKDSGLEPKSRWRFLLKNYAAWALGAVSFSLGVVSMSLVFFMIRYDEMGMRSRTWDGWLTAIPVFWMACLAVFTAAVIYNVRHTRKGYRYPPLLISAYVILTSVLAGGIFHVSGFDTEVDDILGRRAPLYDRVINPHVGYWSQPENGRLSGMVRSRIGDDGYIVIDRDSEEWKVRTAQIGTFRPEIGHPARFLGAVRGNHEFMAEKIMPVMTGRGFFDRQHGPSRPGGMMGPGFRGGMNPVQIQSQ